MSKKRKTVESEEKSSDRDGQINRNREITLFLSDPELLDCFICMRPLRAPLFQCENEHTMCSSCCEDLKKSVCKGCPNCSKPVGHIRSRTLEKLLESFQISCPKPGY